MDLSEIDSSEMESETETSELLAYLWAQLNGQRSPRRNSRTQSYIASTTDLSTYCLPSYAWMDNASVPPLNPCSLARIFIDQCQSSSSKGWYNLPKLATDNNWGDGRPRVYATVPAELADDCLCSLPVYILIEGCAYCQRNDSLAFFKSLTPSVRAFFQSVTLLLPDKVRVVMLIDLRLHSLTNSQQTVQTDLYNIQRKIQKCLCHPGPSWPTILGSLTCHMR